MVDQCKCDLRIRLVGDGCRYCQPQTYIAHLEMALEEARQELEAAEIGAKMQGE